MMLLFAELVLHHNLLFTRPSGDEGSSLIPKYGRSTGGVSTTPPVPQTLFTKAFQDKTGGWEVGFRLSTQIRKRQNGKTPYGHSLNNKRTTRFE